MHKILLADDHGLSLDGLQRLLEDGGKAQVVGTATNGIEAIGLIKSLRPDCAVLDISMPGANGVETMIEARRWMPDTRFVILTANQTAQTLAKAIEAGAEGMLLKTEHPETIRDSILSVCAGARVVSDAAEALLTRASSDDGLTAREFEVLQALARGLSNKGISDRLGISPKTVDRHRTNLLRKFDVNSTAQLLVRAMKRGIVDVD